MKEHKKSTSTIKDLANILAMPLKCPRRGNQTLEFLAHNALVLFRLLYLPYQAELYVS